MKAILLNGPPRCGKDSIGKILAPRLEAECLKFAQPIIDYMDHFFGVSCEDGEDKSKPCDRLNGRSRRQIAISYSEDFCKPNFGQDFFGRYALQQATVMAVRSRLAIFTDSGFASEAKILRDGLGSKNVLQIRIVRPGYDYNGDSRSYWTLAGVQSLEFRNDMQFGELFSSVVANLVPDIQAWMTQQ